MTPLLPPVTGALEEFASLFDYPRDGAIPGAPLLLEFTEWRERLQPFFAPLSRLGAGAREELHTATFDITPAAVPYLGILLFGEENFKRGEFMAALLARYHATGLDPGPELPDHLATVLRFAARTAAEERTELVAFCLLGSVATLRDALAPDNPYRAALEALHAFLAHAFPGLKPVPAPRAASRGTDSPCASFAASCQCPPADPFDEPLIPAVPGRAAA